MARRRLFGWNVRLLTGGSTYGVSTRESGHEARQRAANCPGKNLSRFTLRVSLTTGQTNGDRSGRMPDPSRAQERAFAERGTPRAPRLWTTGQAHGTGARADHSGPAAFGHGAECGVHSLWIRLLIRMWGRKVNTR